MINRATGKPKRQRFTLLHSNDMHGDFAAEVSGAEGRLIGGLSLLSGYINEVRSKEKNVIYVISGDMVQGSLIDAEFKGISTIEIMNYLAPDVVTLGNHELDYGLPHLLFLEKLANFPIVNANLYIRKYNKRLMHPYVILKRGGLDILFIGVITEEVLMSLHLDRHIGSFITLEEASVEVGKICNAYKAEDIDLTVLLTHIGFESDKKLAAILDPAWGVDIIIGGHSHTLLDKPALVNNILIAQAGVGTAQIGRFDIVVDEATNSIAEWDWRLVPIDDSNIDPDRELQEFIDSYKQVVDQKYNRIICRLSQKLTHPKREQETAIGNLFADILAERSCTDLSLVSSGSIRGTEMGPIVTLGDMHRVYPFSQPLHKITVDGSQLKRMFEAFLKLENRGGEGNFFQVSGNVRAVYNDSEKSLISLTLRGKKILDSATYTVALQDYAFRNAAKIFCLDDGFLERPDLHHVVATSCRDVLEEYLTVHPNLNSHVEGRLRIISEG